MTMLVKTYCLRCERPADGCKCKDKSLNISHSTKLRPPLTTNNKERFRKFLDDCPTFANLIQDHQIEAFKKFLRKLKYYKPINGINWISKEI